MAPWGRLRSRSGSRFSGAAASALAAAAWLLLGLTALALAAVSYPALTGRIVDGAAILPPDALQRIEAKLKAHEDKTSDQIVVATVPSLQGVSVEDFANGLFRFWKLGEKARNNGVLLLIAPSERKLRIEVGYGLEGALTDALAKVIITTAIAPKFKTGDFAGGTEAGVDAILSILAGDAEEWQRRATIRDDTRSGGDLAGVIFAMIVIVIMASILINGFRQATGARRHRLRNGRWVTLPASTGAGWGTGSSGWGSGSSGGSWGSGSGGFSGGGGSSGGGGASGDW